MKRKKKDLRPLAQGLFVKKDAGNVEKNTEIFNKNMVNGKVQDISSDIQASGNEAGLGENIRRNKMKSLNEESKRYYYDDAVDYIEDHGISCDPAGHYEGEYVCDLLDDYNDGYSPKYDEPYYYKPTLDYIIKLTKESLKQDYNDYKRQIDNGEELDEDELEIFNYVSKVLGKETLSENLDNIVDVEEKSREVVSPAFGAAVRDIKKNNKKHDKVTAIKETPKEGEKDLPKDTKLVLDESLFESVNINEKYWEKQIPEDIARNFRNVVNSDNEKIGPAIDATESLLSWIEKEFPDSSYQADEIRENISLLDRNDYCEADFDEYDDYDDEYEEPRTVEDYFNEEVLDPLYDLCDDLNIWIPTAMDESKLLTRVKGPSNKDFTPDMKLRDAYEIYDPEEFQLDHISNDITIEELWRKMQDGENVYIIASVDGQGFDSAVREGLFIIMEEALDVDYDTIYQTWLNN